jgi:hypothetical protein
MSISVLNTDANLSGKTVIAAENADTITGAKTFDRDPAAPFIVTPGSAKVDNLDADKLDGQEGSFYTNLDNMTGAWTVWTPTWTNLTVGNGLITARYRRIGKTVHFALVFTFGSTSSISGAVSVSLPATAQNASLIHARFIMVDQGTAFVAGNVLPNTTTSISLADATVAALANVTATVPFTWTTNDVMYISGFFEEA